MKKSIIIILLLGLWIPFSVHYEMSNLERYVNKEFEETL